MGRLSPVASGTAQLGGQPPEHAEAPPSADRSAMRRLSPPTWLLALGACLLSWPAWSSLVPATDLDSAWQGALHLAARDGLSFGDDVQWTYGPLGFLLFPQMWSAGTGAVALAAVAALRVLTAVLLVSVGRERVGWATATFGTWAALLLTPNEMLAVPAGFAAAIAIWTGCATRRRFMLAAAGSGVFVGLQMLTKLSTGPFIALLLVVALAASSRPIRDRGLATCAALVAGTLAIVAACRAVEQPLDALPGWLRWGQELADGYGEAMGYADPSLVHELRIALALGVGGAIIAFANAGGRDAARRVALPVLWLAVWFAAFRAGFLRHDGAHATQFTGTMAAGVVLLPWGKNLRLVPVALVLLILVMADGELELGVRDRMTPRENVSAALDQIAVLASPAERRALEVQGRRAIVRTAGLSPATTSVLRRGTSTVYPASLSLVGAYRLRWRPLPVLQAHMAYRPGLDRLDAEALSSDHAPDRILVESDATAVGRFPAYDEPEAALAMLCRYEVERSDGRWLVLRSTVRSRCGPPEVFANSVVRWGMPVRIPRAPGRDQVVIARVSGAAVRGRERLRSAVLRAHARTVTIGGRSGPLVPATAESGLLMSVPDSAGRTGRFAVVPPGRTVTFSNVGAAGTLKIEWVRVSIDSSP